MGLRIQAVLLGVSLALLSSIASALGLGEIRINSSLNQPLDAEVELLQVRSLTDQDLKVGLANADAFEQAGVDRSQFLSDLKFVVDLANSRGPRVKITSSKPVKEPFLNFIIEANWPSGRMLREYTVLVDLPVFTGEQSSRVTSAPTSRPTTTSRQPTTSSNRPTSSTSRPTTASTRTAQPSYDGDTYGPVGSRDTLWDIASKVRPNQSVSIQQTMLAIQRLNPNAFINNNINLLRRGQVLRVPTEDDITQIGSRDAIREVANQNRSWNNRDAQYEDEAAQLEGSKTYTPTRDEVTQPEGRLKLTSQDGAGSGDSGRGQSDNAGTDALETALSATQEELDAARRENSDLRDRLQAMEEQVKTMEKLLQVSSEEMRALEMSAAQTNEAEEPIDQVGEDQGVEGEEPGIEANAATETDEAQSTDTEPTAAEQSPPTETVQPVKPEVAEQPKPVAPKPTPKKSIMDLIMENLLYIGIGAGALVLIIIAVLFMRNRGDNFDDDDFEDFEPTFVQADDDLASSDSDLAFGQDDIEGVADEDVSLPEEELIAEAETEDVVAESDIHIAYGQYDQAEEKLQTALEREPDNTSIRLKLLEVYAALNAASAFDSHFAKVRATGDDAAISRAKNLRDTIEGIAPFDEEMFLVDSDDTAQSFDSDLLDYDSGDTQIASSFSEETVGDTTFDSDELSFDLGESESSLSTETTGENVEDIEFNLDFDTDDSDDTVISSSPTESKSDTSTDAIEFDLEGEDDLLLTETESEAESDIAFSESLEDFSFDIDDSDVEVDFDDVELDVDLGEFDEADLAVVSDTAEPEKDEHFLESDEDITQIRSVTPPETDTSFASLEDDEISPLLEEELSDAVTTSDELVETFDLDTDESLDASSEEFADLDFDAELDSVLDKQEGAEDVGSLAENFTGEEVSDFNFDEFEGQKPEVSASDMEEPEISFDEFQSSAEESDVEDTFDALETESLAETTSPGLESTGFDESDLESLDEQLSAEFNLDDLDQELDELASDFSGDTSSLDEPDLELESEADTESFAQDMSYAANEELSEDEADDFDLGSGLDSEPSLTAVERGVEPTEPVENHTELTDSSLDDAAAMDFEIPDFDPEEDDDSNLGFLSDSDETATKLDLARAYIDMGDADGAKDILDEIMEEGDDTQKREAEILLAKIG